MSSLPVGHETPGVQATESGNVTSSVLALAICGASAIVILLVGRSIDAGSFTAVIEAVGTLPILLIHDVQHSLERRKLSAPSAHFLWSSGRPHLSVRGSGATWYVSAVFFAAALVLLGEISGILTLLPAGKIISILINLAACALLGVYLGTSGRTHRLLTLAVAIYGGNAFAHSLDFIVMRSDQFESFYGKPHAIGSLVPLVIGGGTLWFIFGVIGYFVGEKRGKRAPQTVQTGSLNPLANPSTGVATDAGIAAQVAVVPVTEVAPDSANDDSQLVEADAFEATEAGRRKKDAVVQPAHSSASHDTHLEESVATITNVQHQARGHILSPDKLQLWDGGNWRPISPDGSAFWNGEEWIPL